jgi:hypothetical protein
MIIGNAQNDINSSVVKSTFYDKLYNLKHVRELLPGQTLALFAQTLKSKGYDQDMTLGTLSHHLQILDLGVRIDFALAFCTTFTLVSSISC